MATRKLKEENSTKKNLVGRTVVRKTSKNVTSKGERGATASKTVYKKNGDLVKSKSEFTPYSWDKNYKKNVSVTKVKSFKNPEKGDGGLKITKSSYKEKDRAAAKNNRQVMRGIKEMRKGAEKTSRMYGSSLKPVGEPVQYVNGNLNVRGPVKMPKIPKMKP